MTSVSLNWLENDTTFVILFIITDFRDVWSFFLLMWLLSSDINFWTSFYSSLPYAAMSLYFSTCFSNNFTYNFFLFLALRADSLFFSNLSLSSLPSMLLMLIDDLISLFNVWEYSISFSLSAYSTSARFYRESLKYLDSFSI